MILEEAETHLKDVRMPAFYWQYQQDILKSVNKGYQHALNARRHGIDAADIIEPKIAYDLADRVAKMHNIDIADRLRALLSQTTKEKAVKIAEEITADEYGSGDLKARLDNAVRVSLAVVTEGVTVAPLQEYQMSRSRATSMAPDTCRCLLLDLLDQRVARKLLNDAHC